jgi:hypothetical protein
MKVVVDGVETQSDPQVQRWGELLAHLDQTCAERGVVVADVAFDGVAEPSFREPQVAARAIAASRVDVATATQTDLLLTAIDEAVGAAAPMRPAAVALADAFRAHDINRANRELAIFAPNLGALMTLAGNIAELATQVSDGPQLQQATTLDVGSLAAHVNALIEAQTSGDWIAVADVLEYEIVAAIDVCVDGLFAVRDVLTRRVHH